MAKIPKMKRRMLNEALDILATHGDEAAVKFAKEQGERAARESAEKAANSKRARKKKLKEAYRGGVDNVRYGGGGGEDVVSNAIRYKSKAMEQQTFTYDGMQYTLSDEGVAFSRTNSKEAAVEIDRATYDEMHAKYVDEMTELGRQKDIDAAFGITMTAHEVWDGISGWAKEHPWMAAGSIALGVAVLTDD